MDKSDGIIPSNNDLLIPILTVLSDGNVLTVDQLVLSVIHEMGLPEDILDVKAKNKNRPELKSRIEWACTELRKRGSSGLRVESKKQGVSE